MKLVNRILFKIVLIAPAVVHWHSINANGVGTILRSINYLTRSTSLILNEGSDHQFRAAVLEIERKTSELQEALESKPFDHQQFRLSLKFASEIGKKCQRKGGFLFKAYRDLNKAICNSLAQKLCPGGSQIMILAQSLSNLFWNFHSFQVLENFDNALKLQNCEINFAVLDFILNFFLSKFKTGLCTQEQSKFEKEIHLQQIIIKTQELFPDIQDV